MGAAASAEGSERRCFFARQDDSMFDSIINNVGLQLDLAGEKFEITIRQRYEEDLFRIATVETVRLRGTFTAETAGGGDSETGVSDPPDSLRERTLILKFDAARTSGEVQFVNTFVNVVMVGVRALSFRWSPKPLVTAIPDARIVLQTQTRSSEDSSTDAKQEQQEATEAKAQCAKLEFCFVSANNKENELRVDESRILLNMDTVSAAALAAEMERFPI